MLSNKDACRGSWAVRRIPEIDVCFFLLALLALLFVLAPLWLFRSDAGLAAASQNTAREEAAEQSRAWYDQRMRELADEEMDEAQRTELSEELASVLLAEHPSAGAL